MISKHYSLLLSSCIALVACAGESGDDGYARADQALAEAGENLEGEGPCATVDQVPIDCPASLVWRNHGQYVSCVAKYVDARVEAGDIDETDAEALVREAAQSDVGKPVKATQDTATNQDGNLAVDDQAEDNDDLADSDDIAEDDDAADSDDIAEDDDAADSGDIAEDDDLAEDDPSEATDPDYASALPKDRC